MTLFEKGLQQFEEAAVALSWAGSQQPGDRQRLQDRYDAKKKALIEYVDAVLAERSHVHRKRIKP